MQTDQRLCLQTQHIFVVAQYCVPIVQYTFNFDFHVREGHQEATRLLLDSGAQINVPSGSNDDTPLTLACWKGHEEVVSLLIERNSNVNHQTKTGCTPLMEATR